MITKAIIKRLNTENDNHFIVYIPFLRKANDKEENATLSATLCYIPGITNTFSVGDIVYVSFEENKASNPVIIGKLFTGNDSDDSITTTMITRSLKTTQNTDLSINTKIGESNLSIINKKLNDILLDNGIDAKKVILYEKDAQGDLKPINVQDIVDEILEVIKS